MTSEQDLKASIDRFLRNVSFTAQREIEKVVRAALADAVSLAPEHIGFDNHIATRYSVGVPFIFAPVASNRWILVPGKLPLVT